MDYDALEAVFKAHPEIDSVIHFAGLKSVGESVSLPLLYYHNNLTGTFNLCNLMIKYNVNRIVFSSSATVYGNPQSLPITENFSVGGTTNPYGTTKLMCERILQDLQVSDNEWGVCLLRYFNPIGGHASGLLGEEPNGIPNNLMPYIVKVAVGELPKLNVFGDDYPTKDGTGVRDYIHVVDLAKGHVCSLKKLLKENGVHIYNLGTGNGFSVLELVKTFIEVNGVDVPYVISPRRDGDIAACYADASKAKEELGWSAEKTVVDMCRDSWNFVKANKK